MAPKVTCSRINKIIIPGEGRDSSARILLTIIINWQVFWSPSVPVTVRITVNVPVVLNWWVTFWVVSLAVPSLKLHW